MSKETIKSTWSLRDCFKQYQQIQGGKDIKLSEAIQTALVVKIEQQLAEKDEELANAKQTIEDLEEAERLYLRQWVKTTKSITEKDKRIKELEGLILIKLLKMD